jgi:hypothetical protein
MLCPCCKSELIPNGMKPLETLEEHVCDPNGIPSMKMSYRCSETDCDTNTSEICWDETGGLYSKSYASSRDVKFIDNNDAPFGTFGRQMNVEIDRNDRKNLFTVPYWPMKGWSCYREYNYKSNEDGDILGRKSKYSWVRPDNVVHTWGWTMIMFSLNSIYRNWKSLGEDPSREWDKEELEKYEERLSWSKVEWWRKVSAFVANLALRHRGLTK